MLPFCIVNSTMSFHKRNLNNPTGALFNLMNQLNNFTDDEKENELKLPNCIEENAISKSFPKILNGTPCDCFIWKYVHLPKTLMILNTT